MDQNDIQKIAEIFDSIISSPSPAVQEAFKNLTVLATLCRNEEDIGQGPFAQIMRRLEYLENEVRDVRSQVQIYNNNYDVNGIQLDLTMDYNIPAIINISIGSITIDSASVDSGTAYIFSDDTITFK